MNAQAPKRRAALASNGRLVGATLLLVGTAGMAAADLSPRGSRPEVAWQRARECIAMLRRENRFCDISRVCIRPYVNDVPNGSERNLFEAADQAAAVDCEEERTFGTAAVCAADSNPCQAEVCFRPYAAAYPNGRHRDRVQATLANAAARCSPVPAVAGLELPDGVYSARTMPACGDRMQFGQRLRVAGGKLWWEHAFGGITYRWDGTIDAQGQILATAGLSGTQASGRYSGGDRFIDMRYPQCGPVRLEIGSMLPDR